MSHFTTRIRPISQSANSFSRSTGEPNQTAKWEAVFGPMPNNPQANAYSHYPNVNKQLPDAYIGQNVFLSEKVAGLIATTGAFWTGVLLPWLRSDHIGPFSWSRWEFNQVLATRVPHESVARLVTTEQREYQVRPVRRGLAMQMEGDFVNEPDGQIHFARKIQGMIASIQTTIDFDGQHSILTANDQRKMEQRRIGTNSLPIKEELDIEVDQFAAISKSIDYFKRVVKDAQVYLMDNDANPPFTLLVTPEAIIDMSYFTNPQIQPQRMIGGTTGNQLDPIGELGRSDLPTGDFVLPDGTAVFQVRSINFGSKGAPYQMFSKPKLVAEYYHISWSRYREGNLFDGVTNGPSERYYSDMRSILLKNETTDKMAKITLATALKHGGMDDRGFPDMKIVKQLARDGNYEGKHFDPSVDPVTGNPIPSRMHSKMRRSAHMMLTMGMPGSKRTAHVIHFVGQMDSNVTSAKNIEQMAQTLIASVPGIGPRDVETALALIELIKTLEDAPYNRAFFEALIKANAKRNYRPSGGGSRFVGATLKDEAHSKKWNTPAGYVEWRPDDNGAMTLPVWDSAQMGDHNVPPGMANFSGLIALRSLKSKTHGYGDLPAIANQALKLLSKLGSGFSASLDSAAMDPTNRQPWYLKANHLTTLFESTVNIPRDPLFLIAPPYPGGEAGSADFGGPKSKPTMAAPSLQRITFTSALESSTGTTRTSEQMVRSIRRRLSGKAEGAKIFVETGSASGPGTAIGDDRLALGLALSPTITALRKLGRKSGKAYMAINKKLLDKVNESVRFDLAGMINSPGTAPLSAQKLTLGLRDIIRGMDDDEAIETIRTTASGEREAVKAAITRGAELLATSIEDRALTGVFTSAGDEPTALERIIDAGLDAAEFERRIPNAAARFSEIGQAVDAILSTIALIHRERANIRARQIQAAVEAADVAVPVPAPYDPNAVFYAFPGPGFAFADEDENVVAHKVGDTPRVDELQVQLQNEGQNYINVTTDIMGGLPDDFAGLGTTPIRGVATRPRTGPTRDAEPVFSQDALAASRYYRSSLVMTPGLRDTLGESTNIPLVRPSDPATGHLEPWAGGDGDKFPARLLDRPQYKSFVGGDFQRDFSHSIWNTHHLEFLSYQKRAAVTGNVGRRQYADIFSGTGIAAGKSSTLYDDSDYGEDDIFGDAGVVESLLSGDPIKAHTSSGPSWAFEPDKSASGFARPFAGYSGFDATVLADGDIVDDDKSGAWLINNMNVGSMKYHIAEVNRISNPLVRWAAMAILVSRIDDVEYWLKMIRGNVLVPCNVLLFRPAIEFVMDNFVLMKAGSDTGGTLFNHSSAMLGWDVYTRMIYLNYLFYSKAFIWGPENIYVLENVMPRRYIAGCGVNFITNIAHLSTTRSHDRHDFIAIVVPIEEIEFDEVLGILGNRNQVFGDRNPDFDGSMETLQYSSVDYIKLMLLSANIGSIEQMLEEHADKRIEYFETIGTVPPVVFQGYYQTWDGKSFGTVHAGKGHKGDYNDYPGSRKIWNRRGTPYFEERAKQPFTSNV